MFNFMINNKMKHLIEHINDFWWKNRFIIFLKNALNQSR
jgi:hypothetical protein